MRKDCNIKMKQSTVILKTVNINLTLCSSYLWSWNETHNYYKREKMIRESSFNMTRGGGGEEDIETRSLKS